jgi:hypothetical protein
MRPIHSDILRALLYYDLWHYPLTGKELFMFLSTPLSSYNQFMDVIAEHGIGSNVHHRDGYYHIRGSNPDPVVNRKTREENARKFWRRARVSTHVIKRFPFVRGVMISGDLSKNSTTDASDVDFFVVTEPGRLWIARALLIAFKKVFLLDSKKYFCLNYFAAADGLELDGHNMFLAAEIAHLKPVYNAGVFKAYLEANAWIHQYYPNLDATQLFMPRIDNRRSMLQKVLEFPFRFIAADKLDTYLLKTMQRVWKNRYPAFDDDTRERIFRCTKTESRAYVGNFEDKVMPRYQARLREFGVED